MPEFAYIARDDHGQRVTGSLTAGTRREVVTQLSGRNLFPLEVAATGQRRTALRRGRVRSQLVATTYSQLAALLRSGVPLLRSIAVLRKQTSHVALSEVLEDVHDEVEKGASLADAMARHPKVFGEMATSIIRAGGEGGFLEQALDHVAEFTEKQQELISRTIGALFYPMFLAVLGTLIVNILIIFFVPKFEPLFARLRELDELPWLTEALLQTSHFFQSWWPLVVVLGGVAIWFAKGRLATPEGRLFFDRWRLRVPLLGDIFLQLAVARFCRVLGTLLTNGVPIVRSLTISADATGNRLLATAIVEAAENISAGESLARPLAACGHFPVDVVEMIAVAEESNTLEKVLTDTANTLDRRTWRSLELMVRLIEPILLLILAGVVLLVVVALVLPMLKMSMTI